jgi:hypothetical protein
MLQLREVEVSAWPFGPIQLFATAGKALGHLCDHVLTRPESHYWSTLIPAFEDHLDPSSDDGLYRFARSLFSRRARWDAAQALYDGYGAVIVRSMNEAIRQGWYWAEQEEEGPVWRGLGMTGTYVIWREKMVHTAMLLGYTAPPADTEPHRRTNPLPRQRSWRYRDLRIRRDREHYPVLEQSDTQHLQYHVFKKGAVRVRREYKDSLLKGKVTEGGAFLGSLLDGVPDFDTWQRLCQPQRPALNAGPHLWRVAGKRVSV